jgi:Protein of unknown function (DUF3800)
VKSRFTHVAYIDDAGDFGFPQGSELGCLVALVYSRRDAILAKRRLRKLVGSWVRQHGLSGPPELHTNHWLRNEKHTTGLGMTDRHAMMGTFLAEIADTRARIISVVLDKRENQPSLVRGNPGVIVWHRLFEEILLRGGLCAEDRLEWRIDGRRSPHIGTAARLVRETGPMPKACDAPPRYVESHREIMIQAADAVVYMLYQYILPAKSHQDLGLKYDLSALDRLCPNGVLADTVFVGLPGAQKETAAHVQERPQSVEPTRS